MEQATSMTLVCMAGSDLPSVWRSEARDEFWK